MLAAVGAGPPPRLKLAVGFDEGAEHLRDERLSFNSVAVDVLVVTRVILERGVEVAAKGDAYLHRTKRLRDASEFHNYLHKVVNR